MKPRAFFSLAGAVLLTACVQQPVNTQPTQPVQQKAMLPESPFVDAEGKNLPPMDLEFSWEGIEACGKKPPKFTVGNVPEGTKTFVFHLANLTNPAEQHGGGMASYKGKKTVRPSNYGYKGPCPPDANPQDFKWTVFAMDEIGEHLAKGEMSATFPAQ